jgi:hypothetical protein
VNRKGSSARKWTASTSRSILAVISAIKALSGKLVIADLVVMRRK